MKFVKSELSILLLQPDAAQFRAHVSSLKNKFSFVRTFQLRGLGQSTSQCRCDQDKYCYFLSGGGGVESEAQRKFQLQHLCCLQILKKKPQKNDHNH